MTRLPNIALVGPNGSGKDTVGRILTEGHGYVRVSFADPVREVVLGMDPLVPSVDARQVRLSDLVDVFGWETAKRRYPEVRRLLVGHAMACRRILGEDVWCDLGLRTAAEHNRQGRPVVFTDCRFANEARGAQRSGGLVVEVKRTGVAYAADEADQAAKAVAAQYASQTVRNVSTPEALVAEVADLVAWVR